MVVNWNRPVNTQYVIANEVYSIDTFHLSALSQINKQIQTIESKHTPQKENKKKRS